MRREVPWSRIKRKDVTSEPVYDTYRPKRWMKIGAGFLAMAVLMGSLTIFRIPERLGLLGEPAEQEVEVFLQLTPKYKNVVDQLLDSEQDLDWDGDGLDNGADPHPWEIDFDRNGIPDGAEAVSFVEGELPVRYENIQGIVSSSKTGFTSFRGKYIFRSYGGWASIAEETGVPYVNTGGGWRKAEHEYIDAVCYVQVPGDCAIVFSDSGTPKDREVVLPAEAAACETHPEARYGGAVNAPLSLLSGIYSQIDSGKTVQVNILTDGGEQQLLLYGYDAAGNLLAADTESFAENGTVQIAVQAQLFYSKGKVTMRTWFDFSWGTLSSSEGDVLTAFL